MSTRHFLLILSVLFLTIPTWAQTRASITVCYNPGPYALNGIYMTFVDDKLQNPENFGPNGRVKTSIRVTELSPPLTLQGLAAAGCDVFQIGLDESHTAPGFSTLSQSDAQTLKTWSNLDKSKVVIGSQSYVSQWGEYFVRPGAQNPMNSTPIGESIAFNGPFGRVLTGFNQGGSWQGAIVPGTTDRFCTLVEDSSGTRQPVLIIDRPSGDVWYSDVDILSELGGVTASPQIISNNDIILANLWSLIVKIVQDGPADVCSSLPIPDLTLTTLNSDRQQWPNSVQLSIRVENVGGGTTLRPSDGGLATVDFYLGDPAAGGTLLGRKQTSRALAPGDSEEVSITWSSPPIGVHSIFAVVDPGSLIPESDETNNKFAALVPIGVGPFPLVDDLLTRQKDRSVDLSWSAIPNAVSYNVYRRLGGTLTRIVSNSVRRSFSDTNLTNGVVHSYLVRWLNAQGDESPDGTESSATPTPSGATGANPPTITSRPVTLAIVGQPYSYAFRAADPDPGSVLTYSLLGAPSGMTISSTGAIAWTPASAQAGYTRVRVQVIDNTGRRATQSFSLFADIQRIINSPPVITSTPIRSTTSGTLYAYQAVGNDPDGSFLTWSLDAAPPGMTINRANGLVQWLPTREQVGTQVITIRLTDIAGAFAVQTFQVLVARGNRAPVFLSSALTATRAGSSYQYQTVASDPDGDPLIYTLVGGPSGMTFSQSGLLSWISPTAAANSSLNVTIRVADDGGLTATQAFALTIAPPNRPPTLISTAIVNAIAGSLYSYQVGATDPDLPNEQLTYSLIAAPSGMTINPTLGLIQWIPPGTLANTTHDVSVKVADLGGLSASQSFSIRVGPAASEFPTVSLTSPANGATLTADTQITGTVTHPNLRLWRVEYQPVGETQWFPLTSGTAPVTNGSLGTFPATLVANNAYRIRVYAESTTGSITTPDIGANVDTKQLKMGDFTLAFEDLRVPGFTFPISVMRKYDTKRPQSGDFGPGWTLGFSEVDVRLDPNFNVFLTLPDARRVKFNFAPTCVSPVLGACLLNIVNMAWTGDAGVYDKLESPDCPTGVQTSPPSCDVLGSARPNTWKLTTKEGLKYFITGNRITRMEDRVGNWMQIEQTGITSNSGRNIAIERNAQGLVTKIKEPAPGGELRYEYDAQGRLVRWINLSAKTTTYFYENASFPHYLTKIVDALGRNALRNVFNAEGRLVAQCDAAGDITTLVGCSQFNPQPGTKTFTAINGRGFRTDLISDDRGNVLNERRYTDVSNYLETVRTYDANNNTLSERDPEGNVRSFRYDARGNRLTETDRGGRTTTYTYAASCDKVETISDPAGNVTRNTYDEKCNLRFVRDVLLKTIEYRYNTFGQRSQMVDPNATTWTWNYLSNGLLQSMVDPFGKSTTFSFDTKGNLLSRIDRNGRRIDFQYDVSNRLVRELWDNGRVSTFTYDDIGALLTASDPSSALTMVYDNLGRLRSVDNVGTPGAPRIVMTYSYDSNGNTTQVQDSLGGSTDYSYDALDRLFRVTQSGAGVQPKRVDYTYSPANLVTQLKRFSDLAGSLGVANTNYEYDCAGCGGRLKAIRHRRASDNSVIHDLTFVRDSLGSVLSSTDAEGAHAYAYDHMRRLISAAHPTNGIQPDEFYTYDSVGNRMTSHLSSDYTYSWQTEGRGNKLIRDDQFEYCYDEEGNQIRRTDRATKTYIELVYDHRNRMTASVSRSAVGVESSRIEYRYDTLNRRIAGAEFSHTTHWLYDGLNPLISVGSGGLITRRLYTRELDGIVADEVSGQSRWFFTDQVGTPRQILNDGGRLLTSYVYDSFGRLLSQSAPIVENDILYSGREFSRSGGVGYFRARYYDSRAGRFLQEDPVGPRPTETSQYVYVGNRPLNSTDKMGLIALEEAFHLSLLTAWFTLEETIVVRALCNGGAVEESFATYYIGFLTANLAAVFDPSKGALIAAIGAPAAACAAP